IRSRQDQCSRTCLCHCHIECHCIRLIVWILHSLCTLGNISLRVGIPLNLIRSRTAAVGHCHFISSGYVCPVCEFDMILESQAVYKFAAACPVTAADRKRPVRIGIQVIAVDQLCRVLCLQSYSFPVLLCREIKRSCLCIVAELKYCFDRC